MNNIFSENIQWSIGLIVVLFGIIAAHRLVSYRDRKNIFNNVAKEFTDIFHRELEGLYPTSVNWPKDSFAIDPILREKYPRLENAVSIFKGHLPACLVKGFAIAWVKYYSANGDEGYQCYDHYMPFKGEAFSYGEKISEWDNTKTYKETFKHNVDNLLSYAKQI